MNYSKRYITIKCMQRGKEFIPFWLLNYINHDDYGEGYCDEAGKYQPSYNELVDCIWDVKNKVILLGIAKDIYPAKPEFEIGADVLAESDSNTYRLRKITGIEYEEYDTRIVKIKNLEKYERTHYFTKEELKSINIDDLFELRMWKPFYRLNSGELIKWPYQLKHLKQE